MSAKEVGIDSFVEFWSAQSEVDDHKYQEHIKSGLDLKQEDLTELMKWKAGRRWTDRAIEFASSAPLERINDFRKVPDPAAEQVRSLFEEMRSALNSKGLAIGNLLIWPLFLCHVGSPTSVPIYDRNVWIAWARIKGWAEPETYHQSPTTVDNYLEYRSWFNALVSGSSVEQRQLDRALMAFGQFLHSRFGSMAK
jgi:hypothetical protein